MPHRSTYSVRCLAPLSLVLLVSAACGSAPPRPDEIPASSEASVATEEADAPLPTPGWSTPPPEWMAEAMRLNEPLTYPGPFIHTESGGRFPDEIGTLRDRQLVVQQSNRRTMMAGYVGDASCMVTLYNFLHSDEGEAGTEAVVSETFDGMRSIAAMLPIVEDPGPTVMFNAAGPTGLFFGYSESDTGGLNVEMLIVQPISEWMVKVRATMPAEETSLRSCLRDIDLLAETSLPNPDAYFEMMDELH